MPDESATVYSSRSRSAPESDLVVELDGLSKRYGSLEALQSVTLGIRRGEIFALLGPNGAGKSTLIGCIAGLVVPTSGTARVMGWDVRRDYQQTRRALGLVPQEINYDPFFTVEETLRIQAGYFGIRLEQERLDEILVALDLDTKRNANTRDLSGGMKRRLLIAKALVHQPRVLFLDEPTAGVDVELRQNLWAYVEKLRQEGTTIVLTTHYLEEAEALADRIGVIHRGRLLLVEEKTRLLERLGRKVLRLSLDEPLAELPGALAALGARLSEGGWVLEAERPLSEPLGVLLSSVMQEGLGVRDVETLRSDLEEIYVRLLEEP